ncbi:hypothetical protein [Streptomyces sp. NPDC049906]|uniref:hypothetical protein n=1 Tax=Streptomyces sp. NPDC049906 TaxID=3155656 RepID=UPI00343C0C90
MIAETVCSAVAVAGLGIAAVTAYRKRFLAAARTAAYALVPLGLVMTGAVQWISDLVFSPAKWAGFGVLGVAWALFMTTRLVERRRGGDKGAEDRPAAGGGAGRDAVAPGAAAPATGRPSLTSRKKKSAPATGGGDDFSDIEAILKKHGI